MNDQGRENDIVTGDRRSNNLYTLGDYVTNMVIKDIHEPYQVGEVHYKDLMMCCRSLADEAINGDRISRETEDILDVEDGDNVEKCVKTEGHDDTTKEMNALQAELCKLTRTKDIIWKEI